MTFEFFNTGFDITKNGVYENMDSFLAELGWDYCLENYKFVEPALTATIKVPLSSHQLKKPWDYCCAYDAETGNVYYYYVTGCRWKGRETLEVTLALDTLNTFWEEISSSWTSETHITRRFKDRFYVPLATTSKTAYPKIDRKEEDFSAVPMRKKSVTAINPESTRKWTLVYCTDYDASTELANNPVSVYALPSSSVSVDTKAMGDVTITYDELPDGIPFSLTSGMNHGDALVFHKTSSGTSDISLTLGSNCSFFYFKKNTATGFIHVSYVDGNGNTQIADGSYVKFTSCDHIYRQAEGVTAFPALQSFDDPYSILAGASAKALITFDSWYSANKTNGKLVKIRELPYAPFEEVWASSKLTIPSGWSLAGNRLKFTGTKFGTRYLAACSKNFTTLSKSDVADDAPSIARETKLYNSAFYTDKLVYDSASWAAKWELYDNGSGKIAGGMADIGISYAVSDGMDNGSLFKMASSFETDTDFGDYLVIDKSTDKPYFTNEYLNYIRYGKYYDEKSAGFSVASSIVSGIGSTASTAASLAFGVSAVATGAGVYGAVAGAIVGTAMSIISISKTCSSAYDSINSKIEQYTHQASSVSGTSDVSLFNIYSGNKLLNIVYEPIDSIKQLLFDYFRLYGYADDAYEIPTFTRRYVDYVKCEPSFSGDMIWNEFLDDIKQRMQIGFRVFHLVDGAYDLRFEKENWETSLWDWAN